MGKIKFESSDKLDDRYDKFESLSEDDTDYVPEPEIDGSATMLDSFICVVNKPMFFILFALNVAFMLYAVSFSTLGTWAVYVGCIAEMVVTNFLLFHVCYKYKLSRGKLKVHKIKAWKKAALFICAVVLGLAVAISLAFFEVNRLSNKVNAYVPNGVATDDSTEDTTESNEDDIVNQLAGIE